MKIGPRSRRGTQTVTGPTQNETRKAGSGLMPAHLGGNSDNTSLDYGLGLSYSLREFTCFGA